MSGQVLKCLRDLRVHTVWAEWFAGSLQLNNLFVFSFSEIPPGGEVTQTLHTEACHEDPDHFINSLEHVRVHVDLTTEVRGAIAISIISPMGTRSQLLSYRPRDHSTDGIHFTFMTVLSWGESPDGDWTLVVKSNPHRKHDVIQSSLLKWSLTLYGTAKESTAADSDQTDTRGHLQRDPHPVDKGEIESIMAAEEKSAETMDIDPKVKELLRTLDGLDLEKDVGKLEGLSTEEVDFLVRLLKGEDARGDDDGGGHARKVKEEVVGLMEGDARYLARWLDMTEPDKTGLKKEAENRGEAEQSSTDGRGANLEGQAKKEVEENTLHRYIYGLKTEMGSIPREIDTPEQKYNYYHHHKDNKNFVQDAPHQNWRRKLDGLTDADIDKITKDFDDLLRSLEQRKKK